MTVITYSSAAGRLPKEIQVPEHPSASGDAPEPLSEILKPQTMPDTSGNPIPEWCRVKGQEWIGQRDEETRKSQTWVRGVSRKRMKGGKREERCNLRTKHEEEVEEEFKSGRECVEGRRKSKTDVSWILSAAKQKEERMGKRKRWPVFPLPRHLKNITAGETKRGKNTTWHHIFVWLIFLLFSLCLTPASSQVRVAFKSQCSVRCKFLTHFCFHKCH